jgi:hypothetical protein
MGTGQLLRLGEADLKLYKAAMAERSLGYACRYRRQTSPRRFEEIVKD